MAEVVVFDIDAASAIQKLVQLRESTLLLKEEQKRLAEQVKAGNEKSAEAAKSYEANAIILKNLASEQRNLSRQVEGYSQVQKQATDTTNFSNNSIQQNRDLLKQLTAQYVNLKNPSAEATKQIKDLSDKLKEQEAAIGDTRRNVGNYKDALGNLGGGIGNAITGVRGFNQALSANPIGAVIMLLNPFIDLLKNNAVVADLVSFAFAGLNKAFQFISDTIVTTVTSFDKLKEAITSPLQFIKNFGQGLANAAEEGFNAAKANDEFTVSQQKLNNEIKLNEQQIKALTFSLKDKTKTEQERIKIAEEIAELENKNADNATKIAKQALANEKLRLKDKTLNAEEEAKLSELETAVTIAESEKQITQSQKQTRINILLQKEETKELKDNKAEQAEAERKYKEEVLKYKEQLKKLNDEFLLDERQKIEKSYQDKIDLLKGDSEEELALIDAINKAKEAKLKAFDEQAEKTGIEETQKTIDEINKRNLLELETELINLQINGEETLNKQIEIEEQKKLAILENQKLTDEEKEKLIAESNLRIKTLYEKQAQEEVEIERAKSEARLGIAQASVNSLSALGSIIGLQGEELIKFQKALALAQIAIDTAKSISAGIAGATTSATATGPGAFVATPIFIAKTVATILGALAKATAILAPVKPPAPPKFAEGGEISIDGKSHAQGGEVVTVGGRAVAEVEGGEGLYVMKKNAYQAIKQFSAINEAFGGKSWLKGSSKYLADGGAINAALPALESRNRVNSTLEQNRLLAQAIKQIPAPVLSIKEFETKQAIKDKSVRVSEL